MKRGEEAEQLAERFLIGQGLRVVKRNHRCRGGEIDLVCEDGATLVFVEVRLRGNAGYGGAGASITAAKQRRIVIAARHYLAGKRERACRFDAVLLDSLNPGSIEWVRNAFDAS